MKHKLVTASNGKLPRDTIARWGSLLVAAVFVLMLVGQLFTYEEFAGILSAYGIVNEESGLVLGAIIVVLELAALPALLHMRLSKLARRVAWFSGALVIDGWLVLAAWGLAQGNEIQAGIFGAKVELVLGWWTVTFLLALGATYIAAFVRSSDSKNLFSGQ